MVLGSPFIPTAPTTPNQSKFEFKFSASPMGGDRSPDLGSPFGSVTRPRTSRGGPSGLVVGRAGTRALRRASPAPKSWSQYSTPDKKVKSGRVLVLSPIKLGDHVALAQSIAYDDALAPSGGGDGDTTREPKVYIEDRIFFAIAGQQTPERPANGLPPFAFHPSSPLHGTFAPEFYSRYQESDSDVSYKAPSFSPLGDTFFTRCKFLKFNPQRPAPTNLDILVHFGQMFGNGVTKSDLKKVFRLCADCDNLLYTDRRTYHACDGDKLEPKAANFDLVQELLSVEGHSGVTCADFRELTVCCDTCRRFCLASMTHHHECVREGERK